jgi:hypothetical protein
MKSTQFITIGITGFIISTIIHLITAAPFWHYFSFYTPWVTFLIIGLAQKKQAKIGNNKYIAAQKK